MNKIKSRTGVLSYTV